MTRKHFCPKRKLRMWMASNRKYCERGPWDKKKPLRMAYVTRTYQSDSPANIAIVLIKQNSNNFQFKNHTNGLLV